MTIVSHMHTESLVLADLFELHFPSTTSVPVKCIYINLLLTVICYKFLALSCCQFLAYFYKFDSFLFSFFNVLFLFTTLHTTSPTVDPAMSSVRSRKATTAPASTTAGRPSAPPVKQGQYVYMCRRHKYDM